MKTWIKIIWEIIKAIFGKKRTELDKRIKELSKTIEPLKRNYDENSEKAANAALNNQSDKYDHYDRLSRLCKQELIKQFAEFGEAIYTTYRHKD